MPADAKLVWITREQRDAIERAGDDCSWRDPAFPSGHLTRVWFDYDGAPDPVERRCPDCGGTGMLGLWSSCATCGSTGKVWCIPAPSQLEPPEEATT